jgi:transcriptional regulator with PAS, ATPase and Fis domain
MSVPDEPRSDPPGVPSPSSRSGKPLAQRFRWQDFFEQSADPIFVLDRRSRLLFVNHAWEQLTGIAREEARVLLCRRPQPAGPDDSWTEIVSHALTPPPGVQQGQVEKARRLLPALASREAANARPAQWWDLEFMPLRQEGKTKGLLVLGRITPLASDEPGQEILLPERLEALRLKRDQGITLGEDVSPALKRVLAQARLASQIAHPVALLGEPGTGKATLARWIHSQGGARRSSFALLDCARLPAGALAALLFSERGARQRAVLGTVFLRQVNALPRDLQLCLLEKLQRSSQPEEVPGAPRYPRILAGSCLPLEQSVQRGQLLPELAGALSTLVIEIPPLRQRRDELPALLGRLLERVHVEGEARIGLTPRALEAIRTYTWPGNLRQLFETLRDARARALAAGRIDLDHLPLGVRLADPSGQPEEWTVNLPRICEQVEKRLIELAMRRAGVNKQQLAALLSMPRATLLRRLKALNLQDPQTGEGEDSSK